MKEKVLGVLGGVGPMATVCFTEMLIKMTDAKIDQDHVDMVILNHASIPDRTEYVLDNSKENPLPFLIADIKKLQAVGVDYIALPCNTAHYFYDEIQKNSSVPVINILEETVGYAKQTVPDLRCIGILATEGTIASEAYQNIIRSHGLSYCVPDKECQKSLTQIIYEQVKAGKEVNVNEFERIVDELKRAGSDAVILGCTELSVIKRDFSLDRSDIVDSMECLARKSILLCGKSLKYETSLG